MRKRIIFAAAFCLTILSPAYNVNAAVEVTQEVKQAGQTIHGTVVDKEGEPIIGANVTVKGSTANGTITDINGNFTLNNAKGTLVISFIGYKTHEVSISGKTTIHVTLQEDSELLDEVVVTGYGSQKKASLTSAISQIKGDEAFKDRVISNPTVALQGAVPGLTVTRSSSRPGSEGASLKIRGDVSVNNTSPLILIDGVAGSVDELNNMDGNDIENISVLKDASAAIYGARSAAGVVLVTTKRGKKGKAQISYNGSFSTTIDGIQTPLTTNAQFLDMFYEAQVNDWSVTQPGMTIAEMEAQDGFWWIFGSVLSGNDVETGVSYKNRKLVDALRNGETLTLNNSGKILRYEPGNYFMDAMYGSAFSHKHSFSVSGADEKFAYRASLGYADSQSQLKIADDGETKYSGRLNMDYQATKMFKIETGMSYEKRDITTPKTDVGAGYYDPWFWPYYNKDGQFYDTFGYRNYVGGIVGGGQVKTGWTTFRATAKASLDLSKYVDGIVVSGTGAYKLVQQNVQSVGKAIEYYDWEGHLQNTRNAPGGLSEEMKKWESRTYGAFIDYNHTFNGAHSVSAMLGMTAEEENYKRIFAERNMGPLYEGSDLTDLDAYISSSSNKADGGQSSWGFLSYVTRLRYGYMDKYLVDFLGRRDGSSKLHPSQRWKNFYSISGAWVISQEKFMEGINWLDFLKVRYNYGKTGSVTGIDNYEQYALIKSGTAYFGNGALTSQPSMWVDGMRSASRTWETIDSHNFGLDFTLLNNRLSGTLELFQKENNGMFISVTYPSILGTGAPKSNNGKFRTRGWELELNWRDKIGQVAYHLGGSLSDASSKVVRLENNENQPDPGTNKNRLIGKPRNAIYVYQTDGIFQNQEEVDAYYEMYYWNADKSGPKSGNILPTPLAKSTNTLRPGARKVVDANGDGAVTREDLVYAGDADPHLVFGLKAGLEWKGIDFQAFFQGVGKQRVLRTGSIYAPWVVNYVMQNTTFMGKMWSEDNPTNEYTIASRDSGFNRWNYENKDVSVQNSTYIRLKSLVLGYTLPKTWTQKAALSKVRIYFSGEDLWEWTKIKDGYDPEHGEASNSTFPFSRLLSFGVDITF